MAVVHSSVTDAEIAANKAGGRFLKTQIERLETTRDAVEIGDVVDAMGCGALPGAWVELRRQDPPKETIDGNDPT